MAQFCSNENMNDTRSTCQNKLIKQKEMFLIRFHENELKSQRFGKIQTCRRFDLNERN